MISITKNTKTIVLFVPGLARDYKFYDDTFRKLVIHTDKVVEYTTPIKMDKFNIQKMSFMGINDTGYFAPSEEEHSLFDTKIADIVTKACENVNKAILVKLNLSLFPVFENGNIIEKEYDSVDNQATKLCYIIDAIKAIDSGIHIILVGHSQGGLVNLEAATRKPTKIHKLISISTPYSAVFAAELLELPIVIAKLIERETGYNAINTVEGIVKQGIDDINYQNRILDLASEPFFYALHSKWNSLNDRPQLTVITGTSGHLITRDAGIIRYKQSFDGLVRTSEQKAISYANFVNLANIKVPCYLQKTIFNETCFDKLLSPCNYLCPLPNFGLKDAGFKVILRTLYRALEENNLASLITILGEEGSKIAEAIYAGAARSEFNESMYQNYYDIYASDYSHQFLPQCDETIGVLLSEFAT